MSDQLEVPLEQSRWGSCLKKSKELIDGLKLAGVNLVALRDEVGIQGLSLPAIVLAPYGRRLDPNAGPMGQDEFDLGIVVAVVAASERDVTSRYLGWRLSTIERIEDKFLNTHHDAQLPTGGCVRRVTTEPGDEFMEGAIDNNLDASFLVVRWIIRRARPT